MTWSPDLVRQIAQLLTGHRGSEAFNRFAKQLVIGDAKGKGFIDQRNSHMEAVYEREYVILGHFNIITRFSFATESGRFVWDFGSGVSEGQKLSGHASSKGRHSNWVGDSALRYWEERNVTGVVLVG